jgi:hypothetical protein
MGLLNKGQPAEGHNTRSSRSRAAGGSVGTASGKDASKSAGSGALAAAAAEAPAAAAGAAARSAAARDVHPPADQRQEGPGALQQRQQQRQQQQPGLAGDAEARLLALEADKAQLSRENAELRVKVAALERGLQTVTAQLQQVQTEQPRQAAAATDGRDEAAATALEQLRAEVAGLQAVLSALGASSVEQAQQLQAAVDKGAQAYVDGGRWQQRAAEAGRQCTELQQQVATLQQQMGQLRAAGSGRGVFVAHAPVSMSADAIIAHVTAAAGVNSSSIVSAMLVFERRPSGAARPAAGSTGGGAGGGSGAGGAAGGHATARDKGKAPAPRPAAPINQSTRRGPDGSGCSGSGAGNGGAATGGSDGGSSGAEGSLAGQGGSGAGRPVMGLWKLVTVSTDLVPRLLSGRTRLALKQQQLPIWVDEALSAEQRQQKRELGPVRQQLIAAGTRTRWEGARLMQLVPGESRGRGKWEEVQLPAPPAAEDSRANVQRSDAAAAAAGGA